MEGSPIENIEGLEKKLLKVKGVVDVHDLHVWSLSIGKFSMTCHMTSKTPQESLKEATNLMHQKYGIDHTTIQVELHNDNENDVQSCKQTLH